MSNALRVQWHKLVWWSKNSWISELTSPVNAIIVINVLLFILGTLLSTPQVNVLTLWGANSLYITIDGEWGRLITSTFLHGNLLHLIFNMYFLFQVGRIVEQLYGRSKFILVYFIPGVIASLLSLLGQYLSFLTAGSLYTFSLGASGAIFGILGLFLGASIFGNRYGRALPIDRTSLMSIILVNLLFGFILPGVDNFAHIGGLVAGAILSIFIKPGKITWSLLGNYKEKGRLVQISAILSIILVIAAFIIQTVQFFRIN